MHRPSLLFSWRMLLCWAFVCCLTASAQQAMPSSSKTLVSEWVFNQLTLSDGLSSNCIGALRQDRYGRLWIGTSRGIDRYDGHRMEHLMPGGRIVQVLSMCETNRGMWIGTGEGLFFYEYRSDSLFAFDGCTAEGERLHTDIYDIRTDGADGLWVTAYGQGIYRLRTDGVQPEARRYPLPHDERRTGFILTDREGHVWSLGAWGDDRLCLLNETQGCFESYPLRLRGKPLWVSGLALTETADGWIYIGNDVGRLIRFRPGSHEAELINLGDDLGIIRSLTLCSDDLLLIGSDNGLTFYNRRTGSVRRERSDTAAPGKLTDNFVYATLIDREQTLWAGTYYGGLNRMHPEFTNFTQYKMQGIFPSDHSAVTGCLAEDGEGTVWVGSDGGGIARFDPSTRSLSRVEGLAGMTYVRSLCIDGDVLVAGLYTRGIVFYDIRTGHVKHVPLFRNADGLELESTAQSLLTDADGRLWVGTYSMICTYDRERHCVKVERDSTSVVNGMCEDGRRRLWFATSSGGVLCFDSHSGRWRQYDVTTEGHTGSDVCNVVHADRQGRVWLGTIQGLYRYDERSDGFVPMPLGRACIEILGILDEGEDLWLTSSAGLIHYEPAQSRVHQIYRASGGIVDLEFISGSVLQCRDGMMVAGTSNGFVTFSPNGMKRNSVKPRILFTALEVTGHPVRVGGEVLRSSLCQTDTIHLSYRDDAVRIAFSAMSLVNPQNCRYLYRLEGMEDEWNECGREPIATYTNLSPGTYRLHVRATNNDGVWCDDDAVLTIIVTPPFYWNTPVKILYVLLLAGLLLYGVRRLLRKRDAKHHAEIEQLNIQKEIDVHEARIQFMSLSEKDSSFLASVEAAIERHYADSELTVDLIASEVCVSRSSLFSRLKNISDATPNEMIQMIRLKHAAALLEARTDGVTVSEICYRVGFSSPSYFSKCFQKRYGCTPSEWQQKREL